MNPSSQEIGKRIRIFRKRSGLKQQELASMVGFNSKETISQIERGDREIKAFELARLSQILSADINDFLSTEKPAKLPVVLWRAAPEAGSKQREMAFIKKCQDFFFLEEVTGREATNRLPQKEVDPDNLSYNVTNRLANEIRTELNLGNRPAVVLEKTMAENYGVKIWYFEMEEGSAASTIGPFGPAILMNSGEAPWRRNYNFAHELFHLITWKSMPPKLILEREGLWEKVEKHANAFASSLLLPSDAVSVEFDKFLFKGKISYGDLIEISRFFDVSTEALLYRLLNIKRITKEALDKALKDKLFRDIDKSTMAPNWWEPPELPERFVRLAFVSYQKGKISKSKLAKFLDTSLIDLPSTLREYGLNDQEGYDTEMRAA